MPSKENFDTQYFGKMFRFFHRGDILFISEKIHGTSGRTCHLRFKKESRWYIKFLERIFRKSFRGKEALILTGSRNRVLGPQETDVGYYKGTDFRGKIHEEFVQKKIPVGFTFYYEIAGYSINDSGIQVQTTSYIEDKEIRKDLETKYGERFVYSYGSKLGEYQFFVYRITYTDERGTVYELPYNLVISLCNQFGFRSVPLVHEPIVYKGDYQEIKDLVLNLANETESLDSRHPLEGVCVRVEGINGYTNIYKEKSFAFLLLEQSTKTKGFSFKRNAVEDEMIIDTEEIEELYESEKP
jgi:hypothetical protein